MRGVFISKNSVLPKVVFMPVWYIDCFVDRNLYFTQYLIVNTTDFKFSRSMVHDLRPAV